MQKLQIYQSLWATPYAITDADQRELSDRWLELLQIRDWVREIWAELESMCSIE